MTKFRKKIARDEIVQYTPDDLDLVHELARHDADRLA